MNTLTTLIRHCRTVGHLLLLCTISLVLPLTAQAVEVKNLTMGQHEGRAFVRFDLVGELGEKEADVAVTLLRNGKRYEAATLGLSGDLGPKRQIGPGKMVVWDVQKSFPGGFDEEITWEVTAVESDTLEESFTGMKLKFVKGGCYDMGDTFGDNVDAFGNPVNPKYQERPVHKVCVDDFWMGKYEVTQAEYQKVMGQNPSHFKECGPDCPVENVSWDDAQDFIRKLNSLTGIKYRLPTEAEWEYAAREGGQKVRFGTGDNSISAVTANFDARDKEKYSEVGAYRGKTVRVGSFPPNTLGLHDMAGNVLEWCSDRYDETYYRKGPKKGAWQNPQGPAKCNRKDLDLERDCRVLRSGSWQDLPSRLRASKRDGYYPDYWNDNTGFRLVISRP